MNIPDGWKLVPVEPTPEMIAAGNDKGCCVICMFSAMIASAPTPPASSAGEVDDFSMLIRQLVHSLKKHNPNSEVAARALDYLKRKNLLGSPLRAALGSDAGREGV